MYEPAAFLISSAALTSIFSFFFGNYYIQREKAYRYWLQFVAYAKEVPPVCEKISICAELESRDRMLLQARAFLGILLITIGIAYVDFQFYSYQYIYPDSNHYESEAFTKYLWFNSLIGVIVMINCLELLYIRIAVQKTQRFPYIKLRRKVTGRDRVSKVWMLLGCSQLKTEEYAKMRIPKAFYDNQDTFQGKQ